MFSPEDTIAAVATPLGEGGLGVIRISGTQAVAVAQTVFRSPKVQDLAQIPSHTCHVGTLQGDTVIDQVVLTLFRAPHSYTGEDVVEISAHGNPLTLQKILNLLLKNGSRLAGPGEFTERAFLNGKMDLTQAEAVAELIRAKSDKSQAAAIRQLQGHLAQKVRALRERILPLLAHVEVGLDHSDEDHDFLSRDRLIKNCGETRNDIALLLESAGVSKILREGLRVSLVGRPNVGKSSLLNALIKEERAIVTAIPGTTRDTLEETIHWNGVPVVLTDTAGLRAHTQDPIEQLGMDRTRKSLEQTDVVLAIFDGSQPWTQEDDDVINSCLNKPHINVVNKCDLPSPALRAPSPEPGEGKASFAFSRGHVGEGGRRPDEGTAVAIAEPDLIFIRISAKTGEGLDTLMQTIIKCALSEKARASEAQWLLNARHQAALERARDALDRAAEAAAKDAFEECVALELQTALGALGEIIGETTTEDLLDQIFSKFCIGK